MKIAVLVNLAPCSLVITSILEDTGASTFRMQKCRRLGVKMEGYYKTVTCITTHCVTLHNSVMPICIRSITPDISSMCTWFVQKVSGLTTVHEVDRAYGVLTLIVFNIFPLRSYKLRPTFLPLLETFCELLFRDV